jgi:hypothetical protein
VQQQGAINTMRLATHGLITYDLDITADHACNLGTGSCDPDGAAPVVPDDPNDPHPQLQQFNDNSPGVYIRTEYDPFTDRSANITYDRRQFRGLDEEGLPSDVLVFRRATVTSPGNDVGAGSAQYVRRHYFKVDHPDPTLITPRKAAGIELDRRYYAGSDPTQTPVRTMIFCYGGPCGIDDAFGNVYDYNFNTTGRRPPTKIVTWFGAEPTSPATDGGVCSTSWATKCTAVTNSNFNTTAGKYDKTVLNSTLTSNPAGGITRSTETNWTAPVSPNPPPADGNWLLDLFDHRFTWDGTSLPAGSNGSTVVRSYFDFESTDGFLKGSRTWDSVLGKAIMNCNYKSSGGVPTGDFSQTYSVGGEPTTSNCPGGIPSITSDGDMFGHIYDSGPGSLLLESVGWRKGSGGNGWSSTFSRDAATGFVLEARDPNYPLSTAQKTTYAYDSMGRVVMAQPPGGSGAEWPTTFCYLPAVVSGPTTYTDFVLVKKVTATPDLNPNAANGICKRDDGVPAANSGTILGYHYDGLGRLIREVRRHHKALLTGSYFAMRERRYDSAGHVIFLSDWQACPTSLGVTHIGSCVLPQVVNPTNPPLSSAAFSNFDPFGRAQRIIGPNNSSDVTISRTDTDGSILFSDSLEQVTTKWVNGTCTGGSCFGRLGLDHNDPHRCSRPYHQGHRAWRRRDQLHLQRPGQAHERRSRLCRPHLRLERFRVPQVRDDPGKRRQRKWHDLLLSLWQPGQPPDQDRWQSDCHALQLLVRRGRANDPCPGEWPRLRLQLLRRLFNRRHVRRWNCELLGGQFPAR